MMCSTSCNWLIGGSMESSPRYMYTVHSVDNSEKAVNESMMTFAALGWELVSGSSHTWPESTHNGTVWNTTYVMYWRRRYDPQEQLTAT
jgi:hypothetical protein